MTVGSGKRVVVAVRKVVDRTDGANDRMTMRARNRIAIIRSRKGHDLA